MINVENTTLWKEGFGDESNNEDVARLVTSLRDIRTKAKALTSRIAASLPGLTIHDVSHLDALWTVASTVAGRPFPLNPLEAYIFGATALLHDAGLCFEAYSGGRQALRGTLQWRDAHARLSRTPSEGQDLKQEADLEALRALHASQGAHLATEPWVGEDGKLYLIDDSELRENYGRLIGDIASSHHWDLELVVQRFQTQRPPPPFLDEDWEVDPLKVACMLRVADAGHMDGSRAPSFLLRVLQMNSLSRGHWVAQNRLGRLTVRSDDPEQLMVGSTSPFPRRDASAWWVAFDLVETFDKELRQCNDVLATAPGGPRPTFASKRVSGAGQVSELVKYIETVGWEPTDSSVHVSDVSALVSKLGGEQLYGNDADSLNVALRELIQNAADAVCVRQSLDSRFRGCIVIRLSEKKDGGWTLQVDDDGVGMSQSTLTTDLLDFGRSFWASERAAREFPGVHASGYTAIGRFGIGFFSVFMAANRVNVFSRRFDKGLEGVRCLSFDNGISLRPTLSCDRPDDFGMDLCTRVELELKPGVVQDPDQITIRCNLQRHEEFAVTFPDYVAAMVSGINVPVVVETAKGRPRVHERFPPEYGKREEWLGALSYVTAGVNELAKNGLRQASSRLREIRDGEKCYGLAAVDVLGQAGGVFLSSKAVGGLVNPHSRYDDSFVGLIDHLPSTARRDAGEMAAPQHSIEIWMSEQMDLLKRADLSPIESILASYSICSLGYDPKDVLKGLFVALDGRKVFMSTNQITESLQSGVRLGFPVSPLTGHHLDQFSDSVRVPDILICVVLRSGKFNAAAISSGVPEEVNSLIGVVHRVLVEAGESPEWTMREGVYSNVFGQGDLLEVSVQRAPR